MDLWLQGRELIRCAEQPLMVEEKVLTLFSDAIRRGLGSPPFHILFYCFGEPLSSVWHSFPYRGSGFMFFSRGKVI